MLPRDPTTAAGGRGPLPDEGSFVCWAVCYRPTTTDSERRGQPKILPLLPSFVETLLGDCNTNLNPFTLLVNHE